MGRDANGRKVSEEQKTQGREEDKQGGETDGENEKETRGRTTRDAWFLYRVTFKQVNRDTHGDKLSHNIGTSQGQEDECLLCFSSPK